MITKSDLLLIALAAGEKSEHSPVQIQKLLFLIDKNVGERIGGPLFDFKPYDYGPFDSSIYDLLRQFESEGLASSSPTIKGWSKYSLTDAGLKRSSEVNVNIDKTVLNYISEVSKYVRTVSFVDLVSAVYKAYPEMKVNSVFRGN